MKIAVISGSARKNNNTLRVAHAIRQQLPEAEVVDFQDYDLPSFADGSIDPEHLSEFQEKLIGSIENSDLLFVLSPEYNWFPTSEIINMVHQLANKKFKHIFDQMVVATIGVSTGRGGRMPAVQLGYVFNKIFNFYSLNSITSPKTFEVQEVLKCIDSEGNLLENSAFNDGFTEFLDYSVKVAKRWHQSA